MLNILLRFGEKNQLKFALPHSRNDFFYPSTFFRSQVKNYSPGLCYNIVCNHMRFNAPEVEKLLPGDAAFFTILRDPAALFESSFHYYKGIVPQTWRIPGKNKISEFLTNPSHYFNPEGINSFYLRNLQFFDLGFENNLEVGDPRVHESIEYVAKRFQLVLISDHFEESLILLKDALCWQMDDMLFFKLNARRAVSVSAMSPELKAKAREWNGADWKLYQHFNATFWARVEAYGRRRMEEDVRELRKRNAEMEAICIDGRGAVVTEEITDGHMKPWQPLGEATILGGRGPRETAHHQAILSPSDALCTAEPEWGVRPRASAVKISSLLNSMKSDSGSGWSDPVFCSLVWGARVPARLLRPLGSFPVRERLSSSLSGAKQQVSMKDQEQRLHL
ncbi:Galactosylceramide sulfotransferase [Triplophysa tibetana]|uniref:Galactosylceramide sulfotransferase n=1 Tax=Triplophysa tibetana TaxID=1572043 RepID=A0A5A9N544_9TELE|nr:Galactosylceramide sulfotransferase [Triplophysa tibetana]